MSKTESKGAPSDVTDSFFDQYVADPSKKTEILTKAAMELSAKASEKLEKRIEGREKKNGKGKKEEKGSGSGGDGGAPVNPAMTVSETALEAFWAEVETLDVSTLISEDVIKDFEYQGFNPNELLRTLLYKGLGKGKSKPEVHKDIVDMVTIAVIKGSITDKNLEKMTDQGKLAYKKFEEDYGLKKGGSKGKESQHITVARIAAALPGVVMKILKQKPTLSKQFAGPFGSSSLPYYLRHQASAACIPESTPQRLKDFLLGLITAFTADQTKALSNSKSGAEELFDKQSNFVMTTHNSSHPIDITRKDIFKSFSLESDHEKLAAVGAKIKKIKTDFVVLTAVQIGEDVASM